MIFALVGVSVVAILVRECILCSFIWSPGHGLLGGTLHTGIKSTYLVVRIFWPIRVLWVLAHIEWAPLYNDFTCYCHVLVNNPKTIPMPRHFPNIVGDKQVWQNVIQKFEQNMASHFSIKRSLYIFTNGPQSMSFSTPKCWYYLLLPIIAQVEPSSFPCLGSPKLSFVR